MLMQRMSARAAKNGFGRLIDTARAEPVAIEKHGRPVVVVMAVEEYQRLICGRGENLASTKPPREKKSTRGGNRGNFDPGAPPVRIEVFREEEIPATNGG